METRDRDGDGTVTERSRDRVLHGYLRNVGITHKQEKEMEISEEGEEEGEPYINII